MRARWCVVIGLLLAAPLVAQEATPAPFTEVEQLRIENVNLERQIVERAAQDWRAKVAALKADLERARPGWAWNPADGAWIAIPPKKEP